MHFIKNRFFSGRRPENHPAPLQEAESSTSSNPGSGQRAANGSNAFSGQSALARNHDVSISLPSEMQAANQQGQNFTVAESAPNGSNTEALGLSDAQDELNANFYHENSEKSSRSSRLKQNIDFLRSSQRNIPWKSNSSPRLPTQADFSPSISLVISQDELDEPVDHVIIYLHELGGNEASLKPLARRLKNKLPKSAYILIRDLEPVASTSNGYHWTDSQNRWNEGFLNACRSLLIDVIKNVLVSKCNIMPSNIMILGHCQGGMAALAMVGLWDEVEFGGVISIGGPLPPDVQLPSTVKAKTPALILRAELGDINPSALNRIKETFVTVDVETREGAHDTVPDQNALRPILDFFAHRFHREEWEKQAIVSFDGGGVRGLGSLLILQELMNKVGDEEKRLDREDGCAESSFSPCLYKPRALTDSSEDGIPSATNSEGLPNSSLYLPCHYFNYAAGTSTGGLISIMLSRLRMTVDNCIDEYKCLGEKVFGNPRPMALKGAILWHKFSAQALEQVIKDVTSRHSEAREFEATFPSDEDLCRTVVYAYADHLKSEIPYAFRTYYFAPKHSGTMSLSRQRAMTNHGDAPNLPIWQVARATSAAPGYFRPIKINKGNGGDPRHRIRFKDGGFGTNNPTKEAYYDIADKHGGLSKIDLVISIGTGKTPLDLFARRPGHLNNAIANLRAATKLPSRTLGAHTDMLRLAKDSEELFSYYRFEGGETLGELKMDEWKSHHFTALTGHSDKSGCKTIRKIEVGTAAYLQQRDVQRDLAACARLLVRRRRLRTRDVSKWDRYASASHYECYLDGCEASRIKTSQQYEDHIKSHHSVRIDDSVRKRMQSSRRCWIYRNTP